MRALLVEHGFNRGALAAARELRRAGWTVGLVSSGTSLTARSNSVSSRVAVDFPAGGPDVLVETVARAVRETGSEIVFPVDETQLLILSARRDELGALLPYPPHRVLQRATDRFEQAQAAEATGLAPPRTWTSVPPDAGRVAVKARTPVLIGGAGGYGRFETQIGDAAEAAVWVDELAARGVGVVVQAALTGGLSSMTVLTDADGRLLGQVQQVSGRIWPPDAGTSARATTVPIDPALSERVLAFLEALEWRGFAQLQFLVDGAGEPHLIDFNPRFYGSLALAIRSGVSFPVLWAAAATGQPPGTAVTGRAGARYQWAGGDLRRAVRERRGGAVRDVAQTVSWGLAATYPVWSARDPAPALRSALDMAARLMG